MNKIISLLALIVSLWSVPQQAWAATSDNPERGLNLEMGFAISRTIDEVDGGICRTRNGIIYTPRIGYRFNADWEAGLFFRYDKNKAVDCKGYGAFAEYSFVRWASGHLRVFADGLISYNKDDYDRDFVEVGFTPGIAFNIPHTPVDIKLRYMFIGFDSDHYLRKEVGGCLGHRGNWVIDAGLRRLELGVAVNF